jgi:stage II sporulation protein P
MKRHNRRKKTNKARKFRRATLCVLTAVVAAIFNMNIYIKKVTNSKTAYATLCEIGTSSLNYNEEIKNNSVPEFNISKYQNLSLLQRDYYAVDKKTGMSASLFDINKLMNTDVTINKSDTEPKILIFHTHPHEQYIDSNGIEEGVLSAGDRLAQTLETKYGIKCLHLRDTGFDTVNGKIQRDGAYERMEPTVKKVLADNPSIELAIDLHRDGVNEKLHLATNVDGKSCAKIMYFNGLCQKWENGTLQNIANLSNPYVQTNLALSLKMQIETNRLYPNLARKIYLNAYRYSLHMIDKSMLIELGAQTNTKQEIYNSIDLLAQVLNNTVTKGN